MDPEEVINHLRSIGALSVQGNNEDAFQNFVNSFCAQRTEEDIRTGALWTECLKPRKMLGTDLFITAVHGFNFPPHVFVLPPSAAFIFMSRAQKNAESEASSVDINSHPYFQAISDFYEAKKTVPTVIIPICHNLHWGMLIAREGVAYWGDSANKMPLGSRKMRYLFSFFLIVLKQACPSVSWSLSYENYMTEVLGYVFQTDSYSCGYYVLAALSEFAPGDSPIRHESYRRYQQRRTAGLRDSVVRYFVSQVQSQLSVDSSTTYHSFLSNINRDLQERSGVVVVPHSQEPTIELDAEEECNTEATDVIVLEPALPNVPDLVAWLRERGSTGEIWTNATFKRIKDVTLKYVGTARFRCIEYRRVGCKAFMFFKMKRDLSGWDRIKASPHSGHSGPSELSQRDVTIPKVQEFISALREDN